MKKRKIPNFSYPPKVFCKAFEDNSGAVEMVRLPKLRPRTKHINVKYHHFREHVKDGHITVDLIRSEDQLADIFTKALPHNTYQGLRKSLMGW